MTASVMPMIGPNRLFIAADGQVVPDMPRSMDDDVRC